MRALFTVLLVMFYPKLSLVPGCFQNDARKGEESRETREVWHKLKHKGSGSADSRNRRLRPAIIVRVPMRTVPICS